MTAFRIVSFWRRLQAECGGEESEIRDREELAREVWNLGSTRHLDSLTGPLGPAVHRRTRTSRAHSRRAGLAEALRDLDGEFKPNRLADLSLITKNEREIRDALAWAPRRAARRRRRHAGRPRVATTRRRGTAPPQPRGPDRGEGHDGLRPHGGRRSGACPSAEVLREFQRITGHEHDAAMPYISGIRKARDHRQDCVGRRLRAPGWATSNRGSSACSPTPCSRCTFSPGTRGIAHRQRDGFYENVDTGASAPTVRQIGAPRCAACAPLNASLITILKSIG